MNYLCLRTVVAVLGVAASSGCGLISSDVTNFDLTLPDKKFTIDASGWSVNQSEAQSFMELPCTSGSSVCSSAVSRACPMDCSGTCNAVNKCDLSLDISRSQKVDLVTEKPELKSINDEPVIKVTIDSVNYQVTNNSLNVATPELRVYVAPLTVTKSNDPQATLIGTIPAIPAGQVTTEQPLMFTPTGKAELVNIMSLFKTPFNVLVGSSLLITAGQQVPTGKLESVVRIRGHAGL